jgi:hypothetical protein
VLDADDVSLPDAGLQADVVRADSPLVALVAQQVVAAERGR